MRQLIDEQIVSYFIYLAGSISISISIGIWALSLKKYLRISEMGCFLFGFSLTPYFIGSMMLLMSFIPIKLPRIVYILSVYIVVFVVTSLRRKIWLPDIKACILKIGTPSFYKKELFVIWCCCLFMIFVYPALPINTLHKFYGGSFIEGISRGIILLAVILLCFYIFWRERKSINISVLSGEGKKSEQYILKWNFEVEKAGIKEFGRKNRLELSSRVFINGYGALKVLIPISIMFVYIVLLKQFWEYLYLWDSGKTLIRDMGFVISISGMTFLLFSVFMLLCGGHEKERVQILYQAIQVLMVITSSLTIFILLRQVCISSYSPVVGADANEYLSAALRYVNDLRFCSITLFDGTPDGSLMPLMHHPTWILYLGNALMYTPTAGMGIYVDFAARLAFQMTYIYLFAAIAACTSAIVKNNNGIMLLSTALPLAFSLFSYIYTASSKDAFRLIPLVLLPIVLLGVEKKFQQGRRDCKGLLIAFGTGCFVMMGHPINALTAVTIVIAFSIYLLNQKRLFCKQTINLYVATATGALIGSFQIVLAFLKTGSLMGTGYDATALLKDTAYWPNFLEYTKNRLQGTETYWERLFLILKRDGGILSVPAVVGAVISIVGVFILLKKGKNISEYGYMSIVVFLNSLLLTDIVQWSDTTLSKWCVMNARYTFQIYIFSGIFVAASISKIIENGFRLAFRKRLVITVILGVYVTIPLAVVCFRMPQYEPLERYKIANCIVDEYVQVSMCASKFPGSRVLIDNFYANYYLNDTALTFLSENAILIREAETLEELDQAMEAENISVIMLTESLRDVYWKDAPLEEYVHNTDYATIIDEEGETWIYVRKKYTEETENG